MKDLPYCDDFSSLEAESLDTPEAEFQCTNCGESPAFEGGNDCLPCYIAYAISEDLGQIDSARKVFAGTEYLAAIERELERQLSSIAHLARACA